MLRFALHGMPVPAVVVAASLVIVSAVGADSPPEGSLTQIAGAAGCVYEPSDDDPSIPPPAGCAKGRALSAPVSVVVSPDGRNAYVASTGDHAIAVFSRRGDASIALLPGATGCVAEDPASDGCAAARPLVGVSSVVVTGDGGNVYALVPRQGVAVLRRVRGSGALVQLAPPDGCVIATSIGEEACAGATAIEEATALAVSPDGRNVYVASKGTHSVAVFARAPSTGRLRQLDGLDACVVAVSDEEDATGLPCREVAALTEPSAISVIRRRTIRLRGWAWQRRYARPQPSHGFAFTTIGRRLLRCCESGNRGGIPVRRSARAWRHDAACRDAGRC